MNPDSPPPVIPFELVSWSLGTIAVAGFLLIGRRVWWAWYILIVVQILWILYWVFVGKNPGPIITSVVYILVFIQNGWKWAREFQRNKNRQDRNALKRFLPRVDDDDS